VRGVREPLLWIALASLSTCLPFPHVSIPACAALALSIQLLARTRLGAHAYLSLRIAAISAWVACALNALLLTPLAVADLRLAILSVPFALLAVADSLRRMARIGAAEDDERWFSAVQVLFTGAVVVGVLRWDIAFAVQFLAAPVLAYLVLQFRRQFPLESAR
jgi:hypothetical protein